jgi:hypothetical protein
MAGWTQWMRFEVPLAPALNSGSGGSRNAHRVNLKVLLPTQVDLSLKKLE